jgi:hypothetical protein
MQMIRLWCREETVEVAGALGKADVCNRMLITLDRELEELFEAGGADAFILYIYGLVLADRYAFIPSPLLFSYTLVALVNPSTCSLSTLSCSSQALAFHPVTAVAASIL